MSAFNEKMNILTLLAADEGAEAGPPVGVAVTRRAVREIRRPWSPAPVERIWNEFCMAKQS